MCSTIALSTTSDLNLGAHPCGFFEPGEKTIEKELIGLLAYPNRWFVTRFGGCSCHFREFLCSSPFESGYVDSPEFLEPQDWRLEDSDDVEATVTTFRVFAEIVKSGHKVDIVDFSGLKDVQEIPSLEVSLSEVGPNRFKFFEDYRFELKK